MEIRGDIPIDNAAINFKKTAPKADTEKEAKLHKACDDFEAILVKQMLTTMRKTVPKGGLFNDGFSNDIYQSISDDNLAQTLTHDGSGLGFSKVLFDKIYDQTKGKL